MALLSIDYTVLAEKKNENFYRGNSYAAKLQKITFCYCAESSKSTGLNKTNYDILHAEFMDIIAFS